MPKIKVHIQLEKFNGTKYDFIEVEVNSIEEIAPLYDELEEHSQMSPEQQFDISKKKKLPKKFIKKSKSPVKASSVKDNSKLAFFATSNKPILDMNRKQLTTGQYKKALEIFKATGQKVWDLDVKDLN